MDTKQDRAERLPQVFQNRISRAILRHANRLEDLL